MPENTTHGPGRTRTYDQSIMSRRVDSVSAEIASGYDGPENDVAPCATTAEETDPDLAAVVAVWPDLPDANHSTGLTLWSYAIAQTGMSPKRGRTQTATVPGPRNPAIVSQRYRDDGLRSARTSPNNPP